MIMIPSMWPGKLGQVSTGHRFDFLPTELLPAEEFVSPYKDQAPMWLAPYNSHTGTKPGWSDDFFN